MDRALVLIVIAELFGTSLWFSVNAAAEDLLREWGLTTATLGLLTNAVQGGFILGTVIVSVTGFADRYPASRIFAWSAILGAASNAALAWLAQDLYEAAIYR